MSSSKCASSIPDTSYLASSEFLTTTFHVISCIEVPIHIFAGYIILAFSPTSMSSAKWPLLNLHVWCSLLDLFISFLWIPYILTPNVAGVSLGALSWIGVSAELHFHLFFTLLGFVVVSTTAVYENRYYKLSENPERNRWSRIRTFYLTAKYIDAAVFVIPFTLMVPEQTEAVRTVFENLPCLPSFVYDAPVFVYALEYVSMIITFCSMLSIDLVSIPIFIILTVRILVPRNSRSSLSPKTLALQKRFLRGLMVQTTIPVGVLLIPLSYFVISVPQGYHNQKVNNLAMLTFSLHGLLCTLSMLIIHRPYRNATWQILTFKRLNSSVRVEQSNSQIITSTRVNSFSTRLV